jgi:TPR repeat protein
MNGCGTLNDGLQAQALASKSASEGLFKAYLELHCMTSLPGSAHGMFALAQMKRLGICGVQRDAAAAALLYAAAAQQQHAAACSNLGAMYEYGLGVKQDLQEALRLYDLAGSLGNSVALDNSEALRRKMKDPQCTFPVAAAESPPPAPPPAPAAAPAVSTFAPPEDEALLLR